MASNRATHATIACALLSLGDVSCGASEVSEVETSLVATAVIAFGRTSAELGTVEARARLRPNLSVASGLAYLRARGGYREVLLRLVATASTSVGRWRIDNRSMLSLSTESVERYRNRLRTTSPALGRRGRLNALASDEVYFDLDRDRIVRNNFALGVGATVGDGWRVELHHVWSDNRGAAETRYLMALATVRVGHGSRR
jgi:hypothetical protein